MIVPPIDHIIYIPMTLALGVGLGWYLGARTVQNSWDRAEKRRRRLEEEA